MDYIMTLLSNLNVDKMQMIKDKSMMKIIKYLNKAESEEISLDEFTKGLKKMDHNTM